MALNMHYMQIALFLSLSLSIPNPEVAGKLSRIDTNRIRAMQMLKIVRKSEKKVWYS